MMETQANDKTANEKMNESTVGDGVMYKVDDVPPWYLCILLGLQVWSRKVLRGYIHLYILVELQTFKIFLM